MEERSAARLAEAERTLTETHRGIAKLTRERIVNGKDDEVFIDPKTVGVTMSNAEAAEYNLAESSAFLADTPQYYRCPENFKTLVDYLGRHGINIASRITLKAAFLRLSDLGLMQQRPSPAPDPTPAPIPGTAYKPASAVADPLPVPEQFIGIDVVTGRQRAYSKREVDHMSALDYRKAFKLVRSSLELPDRPWL